MRHIMTRNHNKIRPWHVATAAGVLVGAAVLSRLIPSGEAPSAAPADNGEAIPAATASARPVPTETTPSVAPTSKSPTPTPSATETSVPPMPETGNTESPKDSQKALRELIAKRYISCDVSSMTDAGEGTFSGKKVHVYTVGATYERDPESASARSNNKTDISWQFPDLIPVGIGKDGKPNGLSYHNNSNDGDHDETKTDKFGLPYEDVDKGDKVAVAAQTTATGYDDEGRFITTTVTTICEDTPVMTFNGNDWKLDATPTPLPVYGPHVETVVG